MHKEKVDPRAVAVLVFSPRIAFLAAWAGLPADAAQGIALLFGELVPLVAGRVPQLVKQTVLGGNQPGQQGRIEANALASLGEPLLVGNETIVALN